MQPARKSSSLSSTDKKDAPSPREPPSTATSSVFPVSNPPSSQEDRGPTFVADDTAGMALKSDRSRRSQEMPPTTRSRSSSRNRQGGFEMEYGHRHPTSSDSRSRQRTSSNISQNRSETRGRGDTFVADESTGKTTKSDVPPQSSTSHISQRLSSRHGDVFDDAFEPDEESEVITRRDVVSHQSRGALRTEDYTTLRSPSPSIRSNGGPSGTSRAGVTFNIEESAKAGLTTFPGGPSSSRSHSRGRSEELFGAKGRDATFIPDGTPKTKTPSVNEASRNASSPSFTPRRSPSMSSNSRSKLPSNQDVVLDATNASKDASRQQHVPSQHQGPSQSGSLLARSTSGIESGSGKASSFGSSPLGKTFVIKSRDVEEESNIRSGSSPRTTTNDSPKASPLPFVRRELSGKPATPSPSKRVPMKITPSPTLEKREEGPSRGHQEPAEETKKTLAPRVPEYDERTQKLPKDVRFEMQRDTQGLLNAGMSTVKSTQIRLVGFYTTNAPPRPKMPLIQACLNDKYGFFNPETRKNEAIPSDFLFKLFPLEMHPENVVTEGHYTYWPTEHLANCSYASSDPSRAYSNAQDQTHRRAVLDAKKQKDARMRNTETPINSRAPKVQAKGMPWIQYPLTETLPKKFPETRYSQDVRQTQARTRHSFINRETADPIPIAQPSESTSSSKSRQSTSGENYGSAERRLPVYTSRGEPMDVDKEGSAKFAMEGGMGAGQRGNHSSGHPDATMGGMSASSQDTPELVISGSIPQEASQQETDLTQDTHHTTATRNDSSITTGSRVSEGGTAQNSTELSSFQIFARNVAAERVGDDTTIQHTSVIGKVDALYKVYRRRANSAPAKRKPGHPAPYPKGGFPDCGPIGMPSFYPPSDDVPSDQKMDSTSSKPIGSFRVFPQEMYVIEGEKEGGKEKPVKTSSSAQTGLSLLQPTHATTSAQTGISLLRLSRPTQRRNRSKRARSADPYTNIQRVHVDVLEPSLLDYFDKVFSDTHFHSLMTYLKKEEDVRHITNPPYDPTNITNMVRDFCRWNSFDGSDYTKRKALETIRVMRKSSKSTFVARLLNYWSYLIQRGNGIAVEDAFYFYNQINNPDARHLLNQYIRSIFPYLPKNANLF